MSQNIKEITEVKLASRLGGIEEYYFSQKLREIDQMNKGSRNHVSPGARILWTVTMKLSPVKIELKPAKKAPVMVQMTLVLE